MCQFQSVAMADCERDGGCGNVTTECGQECLDRWKVSKYCTEQTNKLKKKTSEVPTVDIYIHTKYNIKTNK